MACTPSSVCGLAEATGPREPEHTLRAGDHFGEITSISGQPVSETVRAKSPVELFVMTGQALERVMATDPALDSYVKREHMSRH